MQDYENVSILDESISEDSEVPAPVFKPSRQFFFLDESMDHSSDKMGAVAQGQAAASESGNIVYDGKGESKSDSESLFKMMNAVMKRMADQEELLLKLSNFIIKKDELSTLQSKASVSSRNDIVTEDGRFGLETGRPDEKDLIDLKCPSVGVGKGAGHSINKQASAATPPPSSNFFNPATTMCVMPAEWVSRIGIDPIATLVPFDLAPSDMFAIERFVFDFETLVAEYQWPEPKCKSILESKIIGKARDIYLAGLGNKHTLKLRDRLRELIRVFSTKPSKKELKALFQECVYSPGEKLFSYKIRLEALAEPLRPPPNCSQIDFEESLLEQFKEGIPHDLRLEIIRKNPRSLDEAVEFAIHMQKQLRGHTHLDEQVLETRNLTRELAQQVSSLRADIERFSHTRPDPIVSKRGTIICRYCGKQGHIERFCNKRVSDAEALNNNTTPDQVMTIIADDRNGQGLNTRALQS